jgi:hypothetical protein
VNFTMTWEPDARRELHLTWATAPDPVAVRQAADTAEQLLAADPFGTGIPLAEELWRASVPPLVVDYTIDPDQQAVEISNVAHIASNP